MREGDGVGAKLGFIDSDGIFKKSVCFFASNAGHMCRIFRRFQKIYCIIGLNAVRRIQLGLKLRGGGGGVRANLSFLK